MRTAPSKIGPNPPRRNPASKQEMKPPNTDAEGEAKMKKLGEAYVLEDHLIQESIKVARKNWDDWHDVFQHGGPIDKNPVLADPARFASFRREYSVNRNIWAGKHDEFRIELVKSSQFKEAIQDDTGLALDRLEQNLRPRFGSKKGKNQIVSILSKVAAFVRPERFVAWDRFAKKGLNIVLGRGASSAFKTYSDYLAAFDSVWEGQPGKQIRDYVAKKGARNAVVRDPRFLRRVLDVYLMKCGGRWSRKGQRK